MNNQFFNKSIFTNLKQRLKKSWKAIIIIILFILLINYYYKYQDLKWQLIFEEAVPDVELVNTLSFDTNNVASGQATGFVFFNDDEKQPRGLKQYVQIIPTNQFVQGKQVFHVIDIIKLNYLPPKYFDPVKITVINIDNSVMTLSDNSNNLYIINMDTKQIGMFDATKDVTTLVTDDSFFRDYMINFLK